MATVITPPQTDEVAAGGSPVQPDAPVAQQWARKYPPLVSLLVAVLIAAVVLPSSLNVPQSNPSTTLEFAPVPPEDDTPPPPQGGDLGSLGLAGSGSIEQGGLPGGSSGGPALEELPPPAGTIGAAVGKSPRTKRCVGNPPKQSEDPLAPPCVADFSGDNFGATYQGVTREEIRVLIYVQGNLNYVNTCRDPNQATPNGRYFDLLKEPEPGEHCVVRAMRVWQTYFNDRYQMYGRFAHFFVFFSGRGGSAEERKADAADNFNVVKPFAVITNAISYVDAYMDSMAKRGVMVFDAAFGRSADFYAKFAPRVWGYFPTQQIIAKLYVGLLCKKVAPHPVAVGDPTAVGKPRKYGLLYTTDPAKPELRAFKDMVKEGVKGCGITFDRERTFPSAGWIADTRYSNRYAQEAMADFKAAGITTVIWPGGLETNMSKAAKSLSYFPEWVLAGDKLVETDVAGTFQDQDVWDHAFVMTNVTAVADIRQSPCYLAYREADPGADDTDARISGCEFYDYLRQMFTGIQVAGPKLNPQTVDQGFHAIPPVASPNPATPACFYEQGDYTCVKDAMLENWDKTADDNNGCWRMIEGGKRYFAEIWPDGNINAQYAPNAPCNTYTSSFLVNNGTPRPENI